LPSLNQMKIKELIFESSISNNDLANIELILGLNGDLPDSYVAIEQLLGIIYKALHDVSVSRDKLRNAALILHNVASNYLGNPLWQNISKDPAAIALTTRIEKVKQQSLAIYNGLLV
jgi:hypothetical protein